MVQNRFLQRLVTIAGTMSLLVFLAACPKKDEGASEKMEMNMEQSEGMDQSGQAEGSSEGDAMMGEGEGMHDAAPASGAEEQ